jgi:hypothetical protein
MFSFMSRLFSILDTSLPPPRRLLRLAHPQAVLFCNQRANLLHKGFGKGQGLLCFLVRDQAHSLIDETIALAPHLIKK